jgi:hypothetical protein
VQPEPEPESACTQDSAQGELAKWPGGVHRKWVEKTPASSATEPTSQTPCRFGAACTRPGCWYSHPPGHPLHAPALPPAGDGGGACGTAPQSSFTVLTWNVQSASTRGPDVDAADRSGVEACVRQILTDPRCDLRETHGNGNPVLCTHRAVSVAGSGFDPHGSQTTHQTLCLCKSSSAAAGR